MAQDRDRWRASVNAVMNLRNRQNVENSWLADDLLASQEGLCSMKLVISKRRVGEIALFVISFVQSAYNKPDII
jgi:predicted GNAT superfamily acetyltransferase